MRLGGFFLGRVSNGELHILNGRQLNSVHTRMTLNDDFLLLPFPVQFVNISFLEFLQLIVQHLGILVVQPDECRLFIGIHFAQAAARGLHHLVLCARTLHWQNDTGKATAVPALFSNTNKQDNADFRQFTIQRIKLHLRFLRKFITAVAVTIEFQNGHIGRISVFGHQIGYLRINLFLQSFNVGAIDGLFGTGAILINGVLV